MRVCTDGIPDELPVKLQLAADAAERAEALGESLFASVIITDDETIRKINSSERKIDKATDVLSFPTVNYRQGHTARDSAKRLRAEYDADAGACVLGDIVISSERAREQALEYGHSFEREMCYLLVHGLFHLMGYDHMQPAEKARMREMEEKALSDAGMTRDYSSDDERLLSAAREVVRNAYAPYSGYSVGAALMTSTGHIFTGCNIENASFGLTICAERCAAFAAIAAGEREFTRIAIVSSGDSPWPCGACRQVLNEFSSGLIVTVAGADGVVLTEKLTQLLPHGFGKASLMGDKD
ncbi:MAG: cytidine deaminase [Eubacteriales bacterium]|nr:cytidine deaminase [Eubacteriales bacterium]MDD3882536.1 cytidine deaminase [Eubacteriales bacterium]MDD4512836.1 cytidine deaminase [Eubacteriales bacterium]